MISRLRGLLAGQTDDGLVVDVGGVGYDVSVGAGTLARLPSLGEEVRLFVVESTAMYGGGTTLYGFLSEEERRIFNVFRNHVPNTGAKKAMELLDRAARSLADFRRAVVDKDAKALVGPFGFTAKTAEKLVAALQDKLGDLPMTEGPTRKDTPSFEEAVAGLVALGYREPSARAAAQAAQSAGAGSAQDLIRDSLRHLAGRD